MICRNLRWKGFYSRDWTTEEELRAELARMRLELPKRATDELRERGADPASRREVHHRGVEPVAGREPLVLGREDPVVGRLSLIHI